MKKAILLYLIPILFFQSAISQNRKIIDVHFHTRSAGDYGKIPPPNPITGKAPKADNNDMILNSNLELLRKYNVVKAICSGTLKRNADFISKDPSRFISSLEYPDHQNNALPDTLAFKKLCEEHKISAFGELGLQYEGELLNDKKYEPYLAICEKFGIPVAIHTGIAGPNTPYTCCPNFRIEAGKPLLLEPVLLKHPKLKIQLMHMGFPFLEDTKALMVVFPQVYVDISAVDWLVPKEEFYSYLKALITAGFEDRIMYGSDQMIWEDGIPLSIKNVEEAPFLNDAQKDKIFYKNASGFFNIQ
ncbi:amidohydrolase family protein [Flavobacterium daemonense]|uniref:amidohydrolase family protein n=1 Tax=Flavobacterium daemonense TaxID=1393049 RepID=UPI001184E0A9|nr:amidohydrolase family protein [Flavobacterium daemonense]KAF2327345.1 amidohydrolase [Flavobacterium daemonense]